MPSVQDGPTFPAMAFPDGVDLFCESADSYSTGVQVGGLTVTQHTGSDMAIDISQGWFAIAGVLYYYAGATNVSIAPASTGDRRDTVVMRITAGSPTYYVVKGTPCGYTGGNWSPGCGYEPPMKGPMNWVLGGLTATSVNISFDVVLAEIYVSNSTTAIVGTSSSIISPTTGNIVDKTIPAQGATGGTQTQWALTTTVGSGSNGGEISQIASWSSPSAGVLDTGTLPTNFPTSGQVAVLASGATTALVNYTGTSGGNSLTGCTYVSGSPTGTVSTGGFIYVSQLTVAVNGTYEIGVVGGGGGGGGSSAGASYSGGGGGGSGAAATEVATLSAGEIISFVIGNGGTAGASGGSNGGTGGTSSASGTGASVAAAGGSGGGGTTGTGGANGGVAGAGRTILAAGIIGCGGPSGNVSVSPLPTTNIGSGGGGGGSAAATTTGGTGGAAGAPGTALAAAGTSGGSLSVNGVAGGTALANTAGGGGGAGGGTVSGTGAAGGAGGSGYGWIRPTQGSDADIVSVIPNKPQDFGLLGWTVDPFASTGSFQLNGSGRVYLIRFRCVTSGTLGHIVYSVASAGSGLTSGENLVGIYDTGQATAGQATLLGVSGDQTTNFGTAGTYSAAITAQSAGSLALTAGQDYFAAILGNGTTLPHINCGGSGGIAVDLLSDSGLSGTALRLSRDASGSHTALQASITNANLTGVDNGSMPYCFALAT